MTDLSTPLADEHDFDEVVHTFWRDGWRVLRKKFLFWTAVLFIGTFLVMAVAPGIFTAFAPGPGDPDGAFCVLREARLGPSADHWFGTDSQGCDYYTQVIHGARVSMRVAIGATIVTLIVGIFMGSIAGFYGGFIDTIISRVVDGFLSLPYLVGAVLILTFLSGNLSIPLPGGNEIPISTGAGRTEWDVMIAIGLLGWPGTTRLYRSTVLQVKNLEYVQAARALGANDLRLMFKHIFPNALTPVLVVSSVNMGVVIAVEATLTFFGIGLPLDSISWGVMVDEGTGRFQENPHLFYFPVGFLTAASLGFVLMGEQLREAFDPRLR